MATSKADVNSLEIHTLHTLEEFHQTFQLQKQIWGFDETDTVAPRLFGVYLRTGGSCLGAFLDGEMVGYTLAFAAFKPDHRVYWHSHMAGVAPTARNLGIGLKMKLRQREEAIAAGLDLIEWTFDPLQTLNAYFNIEKLGTSIEAYLPNYYGVTSSKLHGYRPSDRLVAAWHLERPAVRDRLQGRKVQTIQSLERIEIPFQISELSPQQTDAIQSRVREQFQAAFAENLVVVGFEHSSAGGVYHLNPAGSPG